jgi:hypothetical protein
MSHFAPHVADDVPMQIEKNTSSERTTWVVMESGMPGGKWSRQRRIAVCRVCAIMGYEPKMISLRARGMREIGREWHVASTNASTDAGKARSQYWPARWAAEKLADDLNRNPDAQKTPRVSRQKLNGDTQ